jgi:hypothetical protein
VAAPVRGAPPVAATAVQAFGWPPEARALPPGSLGKLAVTWRLGGGGHPFRSPAFAPPPTSDVPPGQTAVALAELAAAKGPKVLFATSCGAAIPAVPRSQIPRAMVFASPTGCAPVAPMAVHEVGAPAEAVAAVPSEVLGNAPTKCWLGEGVPSPLMLARMPPPTSTVPVGQLTVAVANATGATGPVAIAWTTAGPLPGGRLAITCCVELDGAAVPLALTAVIGRRAEQAASRTVGRSRSQIPRPPVAVSVVDPVIGCQDPIRSLHAAPVGPRSVRGKWGEKSRTEA